MTPGEPDFTYGTFRKIFGDHYLFPFHPLAVGKWLSRMQVKTLFMEPGCPWENGYIESFTGKLRDELLSREIFFTLSEAQAGRGSYLLARLRGGVSDGRPLRYPVHRPNGLSNA